MTYLYYSSTINGTDYMGHIAGDYNKMEGGILVPVKVNVPIFWRDSGLGDYTPTRSARPNEFVLGPDLLNLVLEVDYRKFGYTNGPLNALRSIVTKYCYFSVQNPNVTVHEVRTLLVNIGFPDEVKILQNLMHFVSIPNGIAEQTNVMITLKTIKNFHVYIFSTPELSGYLPIYIAARGLPMQKNARLLLINIFLVFFSHVPSNEPCSCVSFRTSIWTQPGITIFDDEVVDLGLQKVGPSWTSNQYHVRLSLNVDIMIENAIFCAYQLIEEMHSRYAEINSEYDNNVVVGNDGEHIQYIAFQVYRTVQTDQIKGRHKLNSTSLLASWRTHECIHVRVNYSRAYHYLKENHKVLFCPQSTANCFATCFLVSLNNTKPVSPRDFKILTNRSSRLMGHYKYPQDRNIKSLIKFIVHRFPEVNLTVRNFKLEVIYEHVVTTKKLKKYRKRKYKNKFCEVWLASGHAYAIIDGENDLKEPIEYFNLMETLKKTYPKELISFFVDNPQKHVIYGAFDIETTTGFKDLKVAFETVNSAAIHPYIVGFSLFGGEYKTFKGLNSIELFIDYLLDLPERFYQLYAHNGGNFDFLFILREFFNRKNAEVSSCLEIDGTIVNVVVNISRKRTQQRVASKTSIVLRDSCPLFSRQGLEALTLTFAPNVPKLVGTVDHDNITVDNFMNNWETIEKYLKNDVEGLIACLESANELFNKKFGFSIYNCFTSTSIARKFFLGTGYKPNIYPLYKIPTELDQVLRQGYFGGRCECFQLGEIQGPIYYYDVTSEYPAMMSREMPYGFPKYISFGLDLNWTGQAGVFHAKVKGKSEWGPNILPFRSENGLVFPEFLDWCDGWWYSEELDTAQMNGYDVIWIEGFTFEMDFYFKDSVEFLFNLKKTARKDGNKALENLAKTMINSLYGFWAIRVQDISKLLMITTTSWDPAIYYIETQSLLSQTQINNTHILRVKENLNVPYSYCPISIATTALARLYIWRIISNIEKQGGKVFYCDTDSVICNFKIEGSKIENMYMKNKGADLGELKNEFGYGNSVEKVCIIGPKIYGFSDPKLPKEFVQPKLKGFYKRFLYVRNEEPSAKVVYFHSPVNKEFATDKHTTISYQDLLLMNLGYKILLSTWRFRTKVRAFFDDFEIRKEKINVTFAKHYVKGIVDEQDFIHPFQIKN